MAVTSFIGQALSFTSGHGGGARDADSMAQGSGQGPPPVARPAAGFVRRALERGAPAP
jgi:hypothetical protein